MLTAQVRPGGAWKGWGRARGAGRRAGATAADLGLTRRSCGVQVALRVLSPEQESQPPSPHSVSPGTETPVKRACGA